MFRVGDKVRTTGEVARWWKRLLPGVEGEVEFVFSDNQPYPYRVRFDGHPDSYLMLEVELEKA